MVTTPSIGSGYALTAATIRPLSPRSGVMSTSTNASRRCAPADPAPCSQCPGSSRITSRIPSAAAASNARPMLWRSSRPCTQAMRRGRRGSGSSQGKESRLWSSRSTAEGAVPLRRWRAPTAKETAASSPPAPGDDSSSPGGHGTACTKLRGGMKEAAERTNSQHSRRRCKKSDRTMWPLSRGRMRQIEAVPAAAASASASASLRIKVRNCARPWLLGRVTSWPGGLLPGGRFERVMSRCSDQKAVAPAAWGRME